MRVAILSPYPTFPFKEELGCPAVSFENNATWTVTLARHLAALPDTEVHVLTGATDIAASKTLTVDQLKVHYLKVPSRFKTLTFWQVDRRALHSQLDEVAPDIVHGQGIENPYGYAALTYRKPNLITIHGLPSLSRKAQRQSGLNRSTIQLYFEGKCLRLARNIVVINPFIADYLRLDPSRYRLFHIPNPIGDQFFEPTTQPREADLLLATGWVDHLKAHDVLIEAQAILQRRGHKLRAVIAGPFADTEHVSRLRRRIEEESLAVEFTGFLPPDQVAAWMRRSTVLVHPSRHDNSPMTICEAMALGTPVIASRVGGVPHLIADGQNGLLFESENAAELADKIQFLLENPTVRAQIAENARQSARTRYRPQQVAEQTRAAYEQVLAAVAKSSAKRQRTNWSWSQLLQSQKPRIRRAAAVVPAQWRKPPRYWDWRQFLARAQFWPRDQIEAWQLVRLKNLIRHAYENAPGYRALYDQAGIQPKDIQSLHDFRHLPFTTKEMFRDHLEEFSVRRPGRRYVTTGGSTGIPFGFYLTGGNEAVELAFMHHMWARRGWQLGALNAVLRGGYIGTREVPCLYDPFRNELNMSSYHLMPETLPAYLDAFRRWKVRVLQAYPSSLHMLCSLMNDAGQAGTIPLELILLGSENIYDWQLKLFEKVFPTARLFAWYGHAEKVILAPWCEPSRRYHAWPFYGITEVIGPDQSLAAVGTEGGLVGTSLLNFVTPFIRYRTMDLAVAGPIGCADCGRKFQLLEKIVGRSHEVIVTGTGRHISMTAINMHDRSFDDLRQFQFYQDTPGRVEFKFIPKSELSPSQIEQLRQTLASKFGSDTVLTLTAVKEIPRTKSGKYRFLDQRLNIKYGDR